MQISLFFVKELLLAFVLNIHHDSKLMKSELAFINPNSLDDKGSCWILKDFYCSETMLRELGCYCSIKTCWGVVTCDNGEVSFSLVATAQSVLILSYAT